MPILNQRLLLFGFEEKTNSGDIQGLAVLTLKDSMSIPFDDLGQIIFKPVKLDIIFT